MRSFTRLRPRRHRDGSPSGSFTLLEVLVTLAVLLLVLITLIQFMGGIDQAWKSAEADPFAEAQNAFEVVAQRLSAATLAPYQDYANSGGAFRTDSTSAFTPDHLARRSDLDFVCGPGSGTNGLLTASGRTTCGSCVFFLAQNGYTQTYAHEGMEHLLNAMGYFVEFSDDNSAPGFILPQTHYWRWRLKQILQPAEALQIFSGTTSLTSSAWIQLLVPSGTFPPVLAENVVALIILPQRAANDSGPALSPGYRYDSRDTTNLLTLHQLPARLQLVLVAIDPTSAERLAALNGSSPPSLVPATLFQQATQLNSDLATLDGLLTAQKIGHRIYQREILLPSTDWSDMPSP